MEFLDAVLPIDQGCLSASLAEQVWQLGDVRRYASSFIESQTVGDLCIVRIGVAVDIGESLCVRVHDLEAAV